MSPNQNNELKTTSGAGGSVLLCGLLSRNNTFHLMARCKMSDFCIKMSKWLGKCHLFCCEYICFSLNVFNSIQGNNETLFNVLCVSFCCQSNPFSPSNTELKQVWFFSAAQRHLGILWHHSEILLTEYFKTNEHVCMTLEILWYRASQNRTNTFR